VTGNDIRPDWSTRFCVRGGAAECFASCITVNTDGADICLYWMAEVSKVREK